MSEVATVGSNGALIGFIERAARDPDFDIQKFGELLRMQRDVTHEQARQAFNRAMAKAQAEMEPVLRSAVNAHTKSKYAKLETIDAAMRPIYTSHGFSVRFGSAPSPREEWMRIVCTVAHDGGYSEQNHLDAPLDVGGAQGRSNKTSVQAVGSSVTYLRRYLLTMVFNIVLADDPDDDDGEAAGRGRPVRPAASARTSPLAEDVHQAASPSVRAGPPPGNGPRTSPATKPPPTQVRPAYEWPSLLEPDGTKWLANFLRVADECASIEEAEELAREPTVTASLEKAPNHVKRDITEKLADTYARLRTAQQTAETVKEANWEEIGNDPLYDVVPPELQTAPPRRSARTPDDDMTIDDPSLQSKAHDVDYYLGLVSKMDLAELNRKATDAAYRKELQDNLTQADQGRVWAFVRERSIELRQA